METHRPVLLAFQTTTEGIDDGTLDAVTLVLLVGFIVSMVALSVLLARNQREAPDEPFVVPDAPPIPETASVAVQRPRSEARPTPVSTTETPVWLTGVALAPPTPALSEATELIEQLLAARRVGNLAEGIALFSPAYRTRLASELGVPERELEHVLSGAAIAGDAPALRSVEILPGAGNVTSVRVGYVDGSAEIYRLLGIEGRLAIDAIERG